SCGTDPIRFFFQAEDGIRAFHVTGVQTCALPIFTRAPFWSWVASHIWRTCWPSRKEKATRQASSGCRVVTVRVAWKPSGHWWTRSEERRVGKEGGCRGAQDE